jgi:hypothetical protein
MRAPALLLSAAMTLLLPVSAQADPEAREQFVASNMIATFYHEFGHALVDLLGIPVLGREEDAVDALATLLIDLLWEPEDAAILISEVAYGYALHIAHHDALDDIVWWGQHALDAQRMAAMVCQFFGADPDARAELARDLGMPDEVAQSCIMTHAQITDSWLVFLEDLAIAPRTHGLVLVEPVADPALGDVLEEWRQSLLRGDREARG